MKRLNSDIKNHEFKKVYLLYGDEPYLKSSYLHKLKAAIAGQDEMNLLVTEGKDQDLGRLKDFTDLMPFFAEKRLLIVKDSGLFKTSCDGFPEWIAGLPDTACVIFSEAEVDKRNRLYKKVNEVGYAAELNHPDEDTIGKWILQQAGARKMKITRDAYERFMECTGTEMESIRNEFSKICDYAGEGGTITRETVDAVIVPVVTSRIFEMIEAVAAGRKSRALDLYYDLIALKEPPMRILYLTARQFNQLALAKEMNSQNASQQEVAAVLKVKNGVAGKLLGQARAFTLLQLKGAVELAAELETAVKTGDLNETMACELLILKASHAGQRNK